MIFRLQTRCDTKNSCRDLKGRDGVDVDAILNVNYDVKILDS